MRYLTIILSAMIMCSCSKLDRLKVAGEKVQHTVKVCTGTLDVSCPEMKAPVVGVNDGHDREGMDTKILNTWDIHMMLW